MTGINRRRFIEHSLIATAAAMAGPSVASTALGAQPVTKPAGPNDVIRVGVIGVRGRGRAHVGDFKKSPDSRVVAICDPDSGVIGDAMESVPDATYYTDIRKMLEDPNIDAVSIATPNHWHSLATIWALDAGKHVYVEKPISHNVAEGRAVVRAAARSGRLVQHGTQARSHTATRDAMAWLQNGGLGRVTVAHALCYKRRQSIGKVTTPTAPPSTMDFDLWTGPAAMEPIMRKNLHYDWHWVFNTGNGDIGNQGVHQMDIARWGLGLDDLPARITSLGGRVGYDDDGETANSQVSLYDFGEKQIIFEVRGLKTEPYRTASIGVVFHGEHGYMVSTSYGKVIVFDHDGNVTRTFEGGGNHIQNFLDALRSGNAADLNATALDGHLSASMCHLGNIAYRVGQTQRLSAIDEPFGTHGYANESFQSMRDHLVANQLDPTQTDCLVGPTLQFDDASETFHGDHADAANPLLSRPDREGYAIPAELLG